MCRVGHIRLLSQSFYYRSNNTGVENYSCQSPRDINDINGFKMIWRRAKENANNCYNSQPVNLQLQDARQA